LLSFNIQVGISTERYRHYLTRSWQHLLPHTGRAGNLQKIGNLLATSTWSPCRKPMAAACAQATSTRSNTWPTSAPSPTGINNSIATSAAGPAQQWRAQPPEAVGDRRPSAAGPERSRRNPGALWRRPEALVVVMMHLALGARPAACNWPTFAS
jgi:hypothetical protein